jgi:hypothetical protein
LPQGRILDLGIIIEVQLVLERGKEALIHDFVEAATVHASKTHLARRLMRIAKPPGRSGVAEPLTEG